MSKEYSFEITDSKIVFLNETQEKHEYGDDNWSHYSLLQEILKYLSSRNFSVGRDPHYEKDYKCLSKDHWYATKKNLECKIERYPRGFKLEFYQNVNIKNQHGGFYDFNKFKMMPYLIRLMFINESNKIAKLLLDKNINQTSRFIKYIYAEDKIKWDYVDSWHYPQKDMNFSLSDLDGQTREDYNNKDRDGKIIYNGEIKYFYDRGRLSRGKVYTNLNNMWWVIKNNKEITNEASFDLFDPTPEDFKRRRYRIPYLPKQAIKKLLENDNTDKAILKKKLIEIFEHDTAETFQIAFERTAIRLGYMEPTPEEKPTKRNKKKEIPAKVYCNASIGDSKIQIVYRYEGGHYIILEYNGERIFEYDGRSGFNTDDLMLEACYKEFINLWNKL